MAAEHKPLMMRSNRLLGAALVELNLVKIEAIEQANEKLLELVSANLPRASSVLGILVYDLKVLREDDVLQHVVEHDGVGLVDLRDYDVPDESRKNLDLAACWATWSVPFDREEEFYFVATAYYLSPAVRNFWEKHLDGPILWFGCTLEGVGDYLEKLQLERNANAPIGGGRLPYPVSPTGSRMPFNGSAVPVVANGATGPAAAPTVPPAAPGAPAIAPVAVVGAPAGANGHTSSGLTRPPRSGGTNPPTGGTRAGFSHS